MADAKELSRQDGVSDFDEEVDHSASKAESLVPATTPVSEEPQKKKKESYTLITSDTSKDFWSKVSKDSDGASKLSSRISELTKVRVEAAKKQKALTKELRNARRRRSRVLGRASVLTDEDLVLVCQLRSEKRTKASSESSSPAKKKAKAKSESTAK